MSFFSNNYNTPGPGVPKGEPQKHGTLRFFIVAGRKFWELLVLNLLYFVTSIPSIIIYAIIGYLFLAGPGYALGANIAPEGSVGETLLGYQEVVRIVLSLGFSVLMNVLLGSGPSRAGLSFVLRNYGREEHAFLWSDYKDNFKGNFGKGLLVYFIDVIFTFIICLDIYSYSQVNSFMGIISTYLAIFLFIIYILMHPYIYMQFVTFDVSVGKAFKNAFYLSAVRLPQNIGVTLFAAVLVVGILELVNIYNVLMFLVFGMVFAFPLLALDMNAFSVIKKYMIKE